MGEFLFVYGKNPNISLAEIVSCFEASKTDFKIIDNSGAFVLVRAQKIPPSLASGLGGTLKIAEAVFSSDKKDADEISNEMARKLDFGSLFGNVCKKPFAVSSYDSRKEHLFFSEFFKVKMKERGINSGYVHLPEGESAVTHTEIVRKKLLEKSVELLVCRGKKFHLGKTFFVHNPFEFRKRDLERPAQRAIFAIPPRLCRIMINLSKAKGVLLDPFCGIGSILQEAVLMGFDIRGLDADGKCVDGCRKNLAWLKKEYKIGNSFLENIDRKILRGDARNLHEYFGENSIDAIVTEPFLGPPLKVKPGKKEAEKILDGISPLYEKSLEGMIKVLKLGGRIVIVAPCFKTESGIVRLDISEIAKKIGGAVVDPLEGYGLPHEFPLIDYEERHRTIREINIIEKATRGL